MPVEGTTFEHQDAAIQRLTATLHAAQAQGLFGRTDVVRQLLLGIMNALAAAAESNLGDAEAAKAMQSAVYWDHFEMDIKEALLGSFSWVDPALCAAVREVVDATFAYLRKTYQAS